MTTVRDRLQSRPVRALIALGVGAIAALSVSLGTLWLKCLEPTSEACVWWRAYLPVSLAFTTVMLGVPVFVVTFVLLRRRAAERSR